jgi:ribose-phosphate pyrophosphokinase
VIIYDDMIRTGGSLLNAAHAYRDAGARRIAAICTHGLFPGDALERLEKSGLFFGIVATNSHPRAVALASQGRADGHGRLLAVESVGPLLASHLTAEQTRRKTI